MATEKITLCKHGALVTVGISIIVLLFHHLRMRVEELSAEKQLQFWGDVELSNVCLVLLVLIQHFCTP